MTHDFGLSKQSKAIITQILESNLNVDEAIIYGSRALGTYREGSDIDLTLKGTSLQFSDLISIKAALEDSLLPNYVDVSIYHQLENDSLVEHINRVGKLFYSRKK